MNKTELGVRIIDGCILLLLLGVRELKALREVRQERDEADDALRAVEAALNGIPYKGTYAQGVETLIKGLAFEHTERLELAAQNVALIDALQDCVDMPKAHAPIRKAVLLLNQTNLAEEVLKRRDAVMLRRAAKRFECAVYTGHVSTVLSLWAADIEKETT